MKPQRLVFTFTLFVLFAWLGAASPSALAACEPVFAAPTTIWDFGAPKP